MIIRCSVCYEGEHNKLSHYKKNDSSQAASSSQVQDDASFRGHSTQGSTLMFDDPIHGTQQSNTRTESNSTIVYVRGTRIKSKANKISHNQRVVTSGSNHGSSN